MIAWLLLLLAAALVALAFRLRRATGLPWARVQVSDTASWRRAEQPMTSHRYRLTGKLDYVLETRTGLIPVEVKPGRQATTPYESDLMQLAAYCLLIEDSTGNPPPYGLLRYAANTFRVPYTPAIRATLIELLAEIRQDRGADDVARSHHQRPRCRACGFYDICDDRLA